MSSTDPRSSLEKIGNGIRNVQSFFRGRRVPGTVRLSRREAVEQSSVGREFNEYSAQNEAENFRNNPDGIPETNSRTSQENGKGSELPLGPVSDNSDSVLGSGLAESGVGSREDMGKDATTSEDYSQRPLASRSNSSVRIEKFEKLMNTDMVKIDELRNLAWSGIPPHLRANCWRLLLGYLPPNRERQEAVLKRKRREYANMVPEHCDVTGNFRSEEELGAWRQVAVDVPRTAPEVNFFQNPITQKSLERILYIWGIRHPASGYVQGINDLVTPFLVVFASEHLEGPMDDWNMDGLDEETIVNIEADSYWCLCKLLDGIQDHYTSAQPGIQRVVFKVKELVRRINKSVADHIEHQGVDFLQFAFRWVNCLLVRELPFELAVRLWDTYLAEGPLFSEFLVYVCASFLLNWADLLKTLEFQEIVMFLQKLPTRNWTEQELEMVLSGAFMYRSSFETAKSHLG